MPGGWRFSRIQEQEQMQTLRSHPTVEGGVELIEDYIREEVLGRTKSGYARGLGYGVRTAKCTTSGGAARIQAQRADEAERRAQQFYDDVQQLRQSQSDVQELVQTLVARIDGA